METPSNVTDKPSTFEQALLDARLAAHDRELNCAELHVAKIVEDHGVGTDCWCNPEPYYTDPVTNVTVYSHRRRH